MSVKGVHGEHDDPAAAHHHPLCVRYISGGDLPCICDLLDEHAIQVRAEEQSRYLKAQADERGEWAEEYVIVHDGDPRMDGTHERCQIGRFTTREAAERGFVVVSERSIRAPKANLRIERRLVGPWEVVE